MKSKLALAFITSLALGMFAAGFALSGEIELPGMIVLGTLEDKYEPVEFDHLMHTFIAESCADCHHSHQRRKDLDCAGCHAIDNEQFKATVESGFLPCSMCHMGPDPENPAMPSLKVAFHKQCFSCHRDIGNIGKSPKACFQQCHALKSDERRAL